MARGRMRSRKALALVVLALAILAGLAAAQVASAANGNSGTVKIHNGAAEPTPITRNQPHVCTFHIHALFFGANQTLSFEIRSWPPTGDRTTVLSGTIVTGGSGGGRAPATGAYSLPNGHYKLFVTTATGQVKHKVFWVRCAVSTTTTTSAPTTTTVCPTTTTSGSTTTTGKPTTTSGSTTTTTKGTTTSTACPSSSSLSGSATSALVPAGASSLPLAVGGLALFGLGVSNVIVGRRQWRRRT
jgi:hypothetical protein